MAATTTTTTTTTTAASTPTPTPIPIPVRVQPSSPRSHDRIREEQDRYTRWTADPSTPPDKPPKWLLRVWPGLPATIDESVPSLPLIRIMLNDYIANGLLPVPPAYNVTEFANGTFSRLFKVSFAEQPVTPAGELLPYTMLLRFAAPVDPFYKTESEVATMHYLARHTSVPVPRVFFFDSSANNPLQLEWSLVSVENGEVLGAMVREYYNVQVASRVDEFPSPFASPPSTPVVREDLVAGMLRLREELAGVGTQIRAALDSMRSRRFSEIGSLYCDWETGEFRIGPLVNWEFFKGRRAYSGVARGPFKTVGDYFRALTAVQIWEVGDQGARLARQTQPSALPAAASNNPYAGDGVFTFGVPDGVTPPSPPQSASASAPPSPSSTRSSYVSSMVQRAEYIHDTFMPTLMARLKDYPTDTPEAEPGPIDGWYSQLMHDDLHVDNTLVKRDPQSGGRSLSCILDWDWATAMPPPLARLTPAMDTDFKRVLGMVRLQTVKRSSLNDVFSPAANAGLVSGHSVSSTFYPEAEFLTPRAEIVGVVHAIVKDLNAMRADDGNWLKEAMEFLGGSEC